jgi:hypothetical protein
MANGRCRMHGGRSTGPKTPEGLARLAAAHTTHGLHGVKLRTYFVEGRSFLKAGNLLFDQIGQRLRQEEPARKSPKKPHAT